MLRWRALDDVPVAAGRIIPEEDAKALLAKGVARSYNSKGFELNQMMADIVVLVGRGRDGYSTS